MNFLAAAAALALAGCEMLATQPPPAAPTPPPAAEAPPAAVPPPAEPPKPPSAAETGALRAAAWNDLPGWRADNPAAAWSAFIAGCRATGMRESWRTACAAALAMGTPDRDAARRFFETHFTPHQLVNEDGSAVGLITGYYEPLVRGSRSPNARYRFPVLGVPDDLLAIDLGDQYPELKGLRLRGRLDGRRVVPYYDRAAIEQGRAAAAGREIVWVDDAVELFFLQIQGSGRIALESGETLRVGFADQNARYVFFRELPAGGAGPPGALGVPLTPRRSIAVDPRQVPLGAPVYIATTWPLSGKPLNQLMLAQDTGSAIRGAVRADYFWGFGEEAAREAGRMKQPLRMWVLLPRQGETRD